MSDLSDPLIIETPIADLRPTQLTVGMREVDEKRRRWRSDNSEKAAQLLRNHIVPVVLGPKERTYVVDHHHLALALLREGQPNVFTTMIGNLSHLKKEAFWVVMDNRSWLHPFDANGVRQPYSAIPQSLTDMADDPFRSLAGALHRAGGYAKDATPFSEFLWADYLRRNVDHTLVTKDFDAALVRALALAKSHEASYLPGWCGPFSLSDWG